jgi:hypothetical protein
MAFMISASVAPQLAHCLAVGGFIKSQMGQAISAPALVSSAPHAAHTVAMGLFIFPHFEHVFIDISAGLKHMETSYLSLGW